MQERIVTALFFSVVFSQRGIILDICLQHKPAGDCWLEVELPFWFGTGPTALALAKVLSGKLHLCSNRNLQLTSTTEDGDEISQTRTVF